MERYAKKLPSTNILGGRLPFSTEYVKKSASYFPSLEKKCGRPIDEWQQIVRDQLSAKQMDFVSMLKDEHGLGPRSR